jgi:hypothetical protein
MRHRVRIILRNQREIFSRHGNENDPAADCHAWRSHDKANPSVRSTPQFANQEVAVYSEEIEQIKCDVFSYRPNVKCPRQL